MSANARICVIYNPTARGGKARHMRQRLEQLGARCAFKPTLAAGDGVRLATESVNQGFDVVVAAGGDGTLNEVLNGIAIAPDGLKRAALGVIPLGTVNVFARELCLPMKLERAWRHIEAGTTRTVDVGVAVYGPPGAGQRRHFVQLGGAGLDARAIELVDWKLKQRVLQFAYVVAGFKALAESRPTISCEADGARYTGELVLLGNGRFYGGQLPVFPAAALNDGFLHAAVFARVTLWTILRYALGFISGSLLMPGNVTLLRSKEFRLSADAPVPFELEGDLIGRLPATFQVHDEPLRVIC